MTAVPRSVADAVDLVVRNPHHPIAKFWAEKLQLHMDVLVSEGKLEETQQEVYRARLAAVLTLADQ